MPQALIIALVQVLIQYGPEAVAAIISIAHNPSPTKDDWNNLINIVSKPYSGYTGGIINPYVSTPGSSVITTGPIVISPSK
jgi:hypothetical protein